MPLYVFGVSVHHCPKMGVTFYHSNVNIFQAKTCKNLAAPENGEISCSNDFNIGSVCTFQCEESFSLVGSTNITCYPDENEPTGGDWSDASPMCQGNCTKTNCRVIRTLLIRIR